MAAGTRRRCVGGRIGDGSRRDCGGAQRVQSSFHYRSTVLFEAFERVADADKARYLETLTDKFIPGPCRRTARQYAQGTGGDAGASVAHRRRKLVTEGQRRLA